jgi:hypothetical protein
MRSSLQLLLYTLRNGLDDIEKKLRVDAHDRNVLDTVESTLAAANGVLGAAYRTLNHFARDKRSDFER